MNIVWIISLCLLLGYILRILSFRFGWERVVRKKGSGEKCPEVSLVIPVRNEEGNIGFLLEDLARQDYPVNCLEVILVDDHSDDRSPEIMRDFCRDHPGFRCIMLDPLESGKKAALEKGIRAAGNPLILNTDGDCRVPSGWVRNMVAGFSDPHVRMVASAVILEPDRGFFQAMQSLEFFSLTAAGAGSMGLNDPILCSAANLAYYRDDNLGFLKDGPRVSESGDDIFLMLWLKKKFPGSVRFSFSADSSIRTLPAPDLPSFFMQRIRWSSKGRHYRDWSIAGTALAVLVLNLLLLALLISLIVGTALGSSGYPGLFRLFGIVFLGKSFADLILLSPVLRHYGKSRLLLYFLPLQIIYFMYVSLVGILGQFLGFSWKGRGS